jgi:serpin B
MAMAMAAAGARGETLAEMTKVLHLDPKNLAESHASFGSLLETLNARDGQQGVALRVADRLWGDEDVDFESDFLSLLDTHYKAPLQTMDFAGASEEARVAINRWGAAQTRDLIREVLPPGAVHERTRLVITNAVYFKGAWVNQFPPEATREQPFTTVAGPTPIPMMAQHRTLRHAGLGGVSLVELPYKGGLSMVVFLPDEVDGLEAVESRLSASYDDWVSALTVKRVDLWLPRWKVTSGLSLSHALETMGMTTAFGRDADFTGMAKRRPNDVPIAIDSVLQQAFVEVDEIGTEAAAVSAMAMAVPVSARLDEPERVVFHADHPFTYVIRDMTTGVVLFTGRVVEP